MTPGGRNEEVAGRVTELEVLADGSSRRLRPAEIYVIGRAADADIHVDRAGVSRRHAELAFDGAEWVLTDRSSYGTFVDGGRVSTHG